MCRAGSEWWVCRTGSVCWCVGRGVSGGCVGRGVSGGCVGRGVSGGCVGRGVSGGCVGRGVSGGCVGRGVSGVCVYNISTLLCCFYIMHNNQSIILYHFRVLNEKYNEGTLLLLPQTTSRMLNYFVNPILFRILSEILTPKIPISYWFSIYTFVIKVIF